MSKKPDFYTPYKGPAGGWGRVTKHNETLVKK